MSRLALVLGIALTGTAAASPPESVTIATHAIVTAKTAYIMTDGPTASKTRIADPPIELVAVDLATGKRRWTTRAGVKPLVVRGELLAALDATGHLVVLDTRTGKPSKVCPIMPKVTIAFTDHLGSMNSAWGVDDGTTLYAAWSQSTHYAGGMAPTPEMARAASSHSSGAYELDLTACTATPAKTVPPMTMTMLVAGSDVITPSGGTARISKRLELVPAGAAAGTRPIDLTEGNPKRSQLAISADHAHAFVGDPTTPGDVAVFDLETGALKHRKLPQVPYPAVVRGDTVIVGGGAVVAYDGTTGKTSWTVTVHSTAYRGPYPP